MNIAIAKQTPHLYEFGPFRIDSVNRLLLCEGHLVHLPTKAFDALLYLIESGGHLVEKSEMMNVLWADSFVEEGNLTSTIWTVRKALGDTGSEHKYIQTIAKHGYRFIGDIHEVPETTPEASAHPVAVLPLSSDARPQGRLLFSALGFGALVLASLVVAITVVRLRKPSGTSAEIQSLAVLPFRSLQSDAAQDYLSVGLADLIITKLASTGEIVVRPTTAVLRYANKTVDLAEVGQQQKVDAILSGDIETQKDRIRINVQLVRVGDQSLVWAESYEESPQQMARLEDEVAEKVAESMSVRLSTRAKSSLAHQDTQNPKAFQLYMEGRYFANKRSAEGLRRSVDYFQQASMEDPQYALAYAGLADSYVFLGAYGETPGHVHLTARAAALKSLELDSSLADAYASLGMVSFRGEWNWSEAERYFKNAIALNPNDSMARTWYAMYFVAVGRPEEALNQVDRASELDPASPIVYTALGRILYFNRRYDEAIGAFRKVLDLDSQFGHAHLHLGMAYAAKGAFNDAIVEFKKQGQLPGSDSYLDGLLGYSQALSGNKEAAQKLLEKLTTQSRQKTEPAFGIALIYIGLGDPDQSLKWLTKAYQDRSSTYMAFAKTDPLLDPLRSDARFVNLLKQMGLP
jgi:TolB-like protein/DNA-binding winged helix-turn-helix (wHTH) protein/Flp pilus assembly protein TadD